MPPVTNSNFVLSGEKQISCGRVSSYKHGLCNLDPTVTLIYDGEEFLYEWFNTLSAYILSEGEYSSIPPREFNTLISYNA
jgi:hypothetical protein